MIRIFVALPLLAEWKKFAFTVSEKNSSIEKISWTPQDNLHVTLFFIGEIEENNLEKISSVLKNIFIDKKPYSLEFESIEIKGKKSKPSMVWIKFRKSESFSLLSEKIHEAIKEFMTIEVTHKDPIPHCTLARIKAGADISNLDLNFSPPSNEILVDHGELWKTVQGRDGVWYERLGLFRMRD